MDSLQGKKIVVVVSGGIAAYKAADLVSRLGKAGAAVRVVLTEAARRFVQPLTFEALCGHPIYQDIFDTPSAWEMEHISWARWADGVVVAPATANLIAKMAHGLADDPASTLALAYPGPMWIAPAMNTTMYEHPATRANLCSLAERGVRVIEPGDGPLACGEVGAGRMAEPEAILQTVAEGLAPGINEPEAGTDEVNPSAPLDGKCVLVTAGPTREALDPIRFISNRSTGRMGTDLAAEARVLGARVVLVHGPLSVPVPEEVESVPVGGTREMLEAVQKVWPRVDIAIFTAAVANYESTEPADRKIKGGQTLTLRLRRTPDIARWGGENRRPGQLLVGFAAESENLLAAARGKLEEKHLDAICANPIGRPGVGFEALRNQVTLIWRDGEQVELPVQDKRALAATIWGRLLAGAAERAADLHPAAT